MPRYILAIDQGTTSSRAIVFDEKGQRISQAQEEFRQIFPANGWIEHDPEDIWSSTLNVCKGAILEAGIYADDIECIGITNQRETTIVWDEDSGKPIYNAIVWQDRRTADRCEELHSQDLEPLITKKTGLIIDPYFSATKLAWILENVEGAREKAERGKLKFGTVDAFLLWRLTGGKSHKTDATNAARTMLFNIYDQRWDPELLELLGIPTSVLPEVCDSASNFGVTDPSLLGAAIPITGIAGDQQAALVGQACFEPGMAKSTYGTGCFMILNTGNKPLQSRNRLLTTVGYRLKGEVTYAEEGSIFIAGAAIQWLRDGLKLIEDASHSEDLARSANPDASVYLVPAFTGLGAPYWDPKARGAIFGLTRDTGIQEVVAAGLQSVCYQTKDLLEAMKDDGCADFERLRVDGGMVKNSWVVQFLADLLDLTVERPTITETTALGAAYLAGLQTGIFSSLEQISELWHCETAFQPNISTTDREKFYSGWKDAIERVKTN